MFGAFMEGLFTVTLIAGAVIPASLYHAKQEKRRETKQKVERRQTHVVQFAEKNGSFSD